ncbi:MAG: glycerophosphodiester phosphodiesterase [Actinomycetes bacterium]
MSMRTADPTVFTRRPSVVGHRGLGRGVVQGHRENTLGSLLAAVDAGVDWVELDVTRSADDVLVVHHNPTTADGTFLVTRTAAQLAADGVATLEESLETLPADVAVDVDVKSILDDAAREPAAGTVGLLTKALRRESERRPLLVTSFDAAALVRLHEEVPGAAYGLLTWLDFPLRIAVPMAAHLGMSVVGVHHRSFGANPGEPGPVHHPAAESVAVAHEAGLEVLAWCPGPADVVAMVAAGVDAVVVNDVPQMLPLVRSLVAA